MIPYYIIVNVWPEETFDPVDWSLVFGWLGRATRGSTPTDFIASHMSSSDLCGMTTIWMGLATVHIGRGVRIHPVATDALDPYHDAPR